ncbi:MAG: PRC-barrel domain-containing protein [Planctomycetota bacterium]
MTRAAVLVGFGLALFGVLAWAQQPGGQQQPGQQPGAQQQPEKPHQQPGMQGQRGMQAGRWHKSTDLVGKQVKDNAGTDLGELKNLVIDMNGYVLYGICDGSHVGKKDQLIAIPFKAFTLAPDGRNLVLNTTKDTIANAPTFDEKNWPNMTDQAFVNRVYAHFRVPTPMEAQQAGHMERMERERGEQPRREPIER